MALGRCWAKGPAPAMSDAELDALVAPDAAEKIRQSEAASTVSDVPVLPENWPALQLFLSCSTQWRYAPMGGITGLDYQALAAIMEMRQVLPDERGTLLEQVQWIERGVLESINKK